MQSVTSRIDQWRAVLNGLSCTLVLSFMLRNSPIVTLSCNCLRILSGVMDCIEPKVLGVFFWMHFWHDDMDHSFLKDCSRGAAVVELFFSWAKKSAPEFWMHNSSTKKQKRFSTGTDEDVNFRNVLLLRLLFLIGEVTLMI